MTLAGEPWQLQLASDLIPTQVGESYTFTVWVKAASAGTQIRFSTQPSALYSANYTVDTEWTQLEWVFTANEEMTRLVLDIGAEVNTYFLDDFYLEGPSGGGPGGCQLVDNGGFETYDAAEGTFAGWSYANENGGSSFGLATGGNAYTGDNALLADNAGRIPRWGLQIATPAFPTVTGQSYTLQIWIKAVVADANAIQFSTRDGNGQNEGQYTNSAGTIGGDWTQVSYTFTAIDDHTVITLNLGDETANTYYIDEVCVYFPAETQLMINEYGTENTPGLNAQYVDIIQTLQADDLIDAIGIQGHTFSTRKYGGTYEDLNNLLSTNLDNLAARGLPIIVTEMEIEGDMYFDENGEPQDGGTQAQKDSFQLAEYQRIFDLYWYHPSVVGITMWGWRSGLWQDAAEAYLIDPCTGQERPALQYLNTTIRGSNPMIDLPTDVAEIEPATSPVRVYPTLVDTELNIEGLPQGAGRVQILDLRGRVLKSIAYRTVGDLLRIDLTGLPAGLYIVQAGDVARKVVKR